MRSDDVLQSAVRLFARQGYAATGIRELGREVGLSSATLYHYAGGKQELLVVIMRLCLEQLLRGAQEAVAAGGQPRVRLARLIRAHVGLSAQNPQTARVTDQEIRALSAEARTELLALRDGYEAMFTDLIVEGARAGELDVSDARLVTLALLEMCNGVANWYRADGRLTVSEVQDRFVDLGCRLVGAAPVSAAELGPAQHPPHLLSEPPPR